MTRFEHLKQIDNVDEYIKYLLKHNLLYNADYMLKELLNEDVDDVYTHIYGYLLDRDAIFNYKYFSTVNVQFKQDFVYISSSKLTKYKLDVLINSICEKTDKFGVICATDVNNQVHNFIMHGGTYDDVLVRNLN